ncbi:MAG: sensor histidine kinase [Crocinitomicaceae bacterium]|nr:sensor histidine kinase [Crocinitomicaceae bacterium]
MRYWELFQKSSPPLAGQLTILSTLSQTMIVLPVTSNRRCLSKQMNDTMVNTRLILSLNLDTAIPLGLIINEIISNSLKQGIPQNSQGKITVELQEVRPTFYRLTIGDNGKGAPVGTNIVESDSLGFILITTIIEQLDGKYYLNSSPIGAYYDITFNKQK